MWPGDSQGPGFVVGRSSRNCFQSLGNHWLGYPLRAPSWADENVPESLSYQWGRRLLLPCRKDSAVCSSRFCSHKLPRILRPPPPPPLLPQIRSEWGRVGAGRGCCQYSGATLKVFVAPGRRCYLEPPAPGWEVGKHGFCSLTDGSAPGKEREEGKLDLPHCHSRSPSSAVPATQIQVHAGQGEKKGLGLCRGRADRSPG